MGEQEWRTEMSRLNMAHKDAALLIYYLTGETININDLYGYFKRQRCLSKTQTIMWRLFFKLAKRKRNRHDKAA